MSDFRAFLQEQMKDPVFSRIWEAYERLKKKGFELQDIPDFTDAESLLAWLEGRESALCPQNLF